MAKVYFIVPLLKSLAAAVQTGGSHPDHAPLGHTVTPPRKSHRPAARYLPYCPKQVPTAQARQTLARVLAAHIHMKAV